MPTLQEFFERFDIEIRTNYQNSQRWFVLFDKKAKDYVKEPSQYINRKVIKQFLKSEDIYSYLKATFETKKED